MDSSSLPDSLGNLRKERINTRRDINTLLDSARGNGIGRSWRETRLLQLMAKERAFTEEIENLLIQFAMLNYNSLFAVAAFVELNRDLDGNGDNVNVVIQ
jgi:hypothetical protein